MGGPPGRGKTQSNHQERSMSNIEQGISAYLSGYIRNNPAGQSHVETYPE